LEASNLSTDVGLKDDEYDDTPWTRAELEALAWAAEQNAGGKDTGSGVQLYSNELVVRCCT